MTRRRFAFWLGFGLFSLADKFHLNALDALAAAAMEGAAAGEKLAVPVHWTVGGDDTCRWFERENFINGAWVLTGRTTPIEKVTGEPLVDDEIYLDERLVPAEMRSADGEEVDVIAPADEDDVEAGAEPQPTKPLGHLPTATRRSRHGRPPSKWLRSLNAEEIRIWLKTVKVPEAGVSGMTYWEHLTRDHMFDPIKIKGLSEPEQGALHGAAHFGY